MMNKSMAFSDAGDIIIDIIELVAPLKARKDDKFKARIQRVDSEGGKYIVKTISKM